MLRTSPSYQDNQPNVLHFASDGPGCPGPPVQGVEALARGLAQNHGLQQLLLSSCRAHTQGAIAVAEALVAQQHQLLPAAGMGAVGMGGSFASTAASFAATTEVQRQPQYPRRSGLQVCVRCYAICAISRCALWAWCPRGGCRELDEVVQVPNDNQHFEIKCVYSTACIFPWLHVDHACS